MTYNWWWIFRGEEFVEKVLEQKNGSTTGKLGGNFVMIFLFGKKVGRFVLRFLLIDKKRMVKIF